MVACLVTVVTAAGYVSLMQQQGDRPVAWFLGGAVAAAVLGAYGAARTAPRRGTALAVSGVILVVLGTAGILSVGFPLLVAGISTLVAAARSRGRPRGEAERPSPT